MNDVLLLVGLGGAEKLPNTGLGFPEDVLELTFRLPVLLFFVIVHALQFLHTSPVSLVPVKVCLTGILTE